MAYSERPGLGYTAFVVHWTRWEKKSHSYVTSSPKWKTQQYYACKLCTPFQEIPDARYNGQLMCIWRARLVIQMCTYRSSENWIIIPPLVLSLSFIKMNLKNFKMEPHSSSQILPQVADDSWTWTRQVILYPSSFPGWGRWVAQYHFQGSSQSC